MLGQLLRSRPAQRQCSLKLLHSGLIQSLWRVQSLRLQALVQCSPGSPASHCPQHLHLFPMLYPPGLIPSSRNLLAHAQVLTTRCAEVLVSPVTDRINRAAG